jgi:hypothetical protein
MLIAAYFDIIIALLAFLMFRNPLLSHGQLPEFGAGYNQD